MATTQYFKDDDDVDRLVPLFSEQVRVLNGDHVETRSRKLNERLDDIRSWLMPTTRDRDPASRGVSGSHPGPPSPGMADPPSSPVAAADPNIMDAASDASTKRARVTLGLPPKSSPTTAGSCCHRHQPRMLDRTWESDPPSTAAVRRSFCIVHDLVRCM